MEGMDVKYKPVVLPNGSVKKVKPAAVAPALGAVAVGPMYRECLKNHAANMGGHAVDGCREFLASLEFDPSDPSSFKCAACGCHRNFHRQTPPPPPPPAALPAPPMPASVVHGQQLPRGEETPEDQLPGVDGDDSDSDSERSEYDDERSVSPPPPLATHLPAPVAQQPPASYFSPAQHMLLSLSSSAQETAGATQMVPAQVSPAMAPPHGAMPARKRFRTKFTIEQKQRMQELSERLGWRLQKRDEGIVDEWCRDIGVSKGVFKVWMHNNKHNYLGGHSARRSASAAASSVASPAAIAPPPFNPSTTSSAPTATGFNMNGTAATAVPNGASSPQSA